MVRQFNSKRRPKGFALIVGILLLLVLTLLSLTSIRGTQLELQMATAVNRQEQAIEGSDFARASGRELFVQAAKSETVTNQSRGSFDSGSSGQSIAMVIADEGTASATCGIDSSAQVGADGTVQGGTTSVDGAAAVRLRGYQCGVHENVTLDDEKKCFDIRLNQVNDVPETMGKDFKRSFCPDPTVKIPLDLSITMVHLGTLRTAGGDAEGDELKFMAAAVGTAKMDGASSKSVSIFENRTTR